ncbi:MAG: sel1 repeat family protein [Clostridium sp.]|nr:sel1 repeat family protein [Clostridium sp.]
MHTALNIVSTNELSEDSRQEIDTQIDRIISKHKENRYEINKLVFESVSALTASDNYSSELASQGIIRRFWGGITGKNRDLQNKIDRNLAASQYASQQTLQKLAEQNLMSFELITAVNNKLNASIVQVEEEINKIYGTLVTFFKQTKSDIIQLENRMDKLERNVNLLNWVNSIEYQMWDGVEYTELGTVEKIACIVSDFRSITQGKYSTSDLLLLKTAITTIGLNVNEIFSYKDIIFSIKSNPKIKNKIFGEKTQNPYVEEWSIVVSAGVNKLEKLENEEKYIVNGVFECLQKHGIQTTEDDIVSDLLEEYFESNLFINKYGSAKLYDLLIELLYNIEQLEFVPSKTVEERMGDAEQLFLSGKYGEAYTLFMQLAKENVPRAMYFVGEYLRQGYGYAEGIDYDEDTGYEWHKKGAELGDPLCILNTSYMYDYGSDERNDIQNSVVDEIRIMAQNGDVFAQNELSDIVEEGEQLELLEKSARVGLARAMYKLGCLYYNSEIVEQYYLEALKWHLKASDLGCADAMGAIGILYERGHGLQQVKPAARKWYKKAAEAGSIFAMYGYANTLYNGGSYGSVDKDEAKKWYEEAARLGDEEAIDALKKKY